MIPRPAPKFRSDKELLEEIRRTQPEIAEAATKKDEHLHKNLQDVRHAYIAFLTPISPLPSYRRFSPALFVFSAAAVKWFLGSKSNDPNILGKALGKP